MGNNKSSGHYSEFHHLFPYFLRLFLRDDQKYTIKNQKSDKNSIHLVIGNPILLEPLLLQNSWQLLKDPIITNRVKRQHSIGRSIKFEYVKFVQSIRRNKEFLISFILGIGLHYFFIIGYMYITSDSTNIYINSLFLLISLFFLLRIYVILISSVLIIR